MFNILIGGQRKEIGKLFELLLSKPDRTFTNAYTLDKCIQQATDPSTDLLIFDGSIDTPERCFNALTELKRNQATADIPIVLLTDPAHDSEQKKRLMLTADAQLQEPFSPSEIKKVVENFI